MPAGPSPAARAPDARFTARHWQALVAATLIGAVLRFWCLGEWSVWVDEAHTFRDASMAFGGERGFLATERAYYPTAFLLLRFLFGVGVLGYDEWSLRLPFVLAGIATVPVLALCGRAIVGAWPAVAAAGLLAVNPWHVFWSQNARGYVLAILFATLAIHRGYLWLQARRTRDLWLAVAAFLLGVSCHLTAAMLGVGFVGYLAGRRWIGPDGSKLKLLLVFVIGTAVLALVPSLLRELTPLQGFLRSKSDASLPHYLQTVAYYFRPPALLAAGVALLVAPVAIGRRRSFYLGSLLLVPMVVLMDVGIDLAKVTARYGITVLPVLSWLIGLLFVEVFRRLSRADQGVMAGMSMLSRAALVAVLPLLVVGDYARLDYAYYGVQHGQRARWREAAEFVQEEVARRGLDGVQALTVIEPTMTYYLRRRHYFVTDGDPHPGVEVLPLESWILGDDPEAHLAGRRRRAAQENRLLAVLIKVPELQEKDPDGLVRAVLRRDFELALHLPCWVGPKDESIYVYLPRP